eukprot:3308440-Rhodomonas_salina.7
MGMKYTCGVMVGAAMMLYKTKSKPHPVPKITSGPAELRAAGGVPGVGCVGCQSLKDRAPLYATNRLPENLGGATKYHKLEPESETCNEARTETGSGRCSRPSTISSVQPSLSFANSLTATARVLERPCAQSLRRQDANRIVQRKTQSWSFIEGIIVG